MTTMLPATLAAGALTGSSAGTATTSTLVATPIAGGVGGPGPATGVSLGHPCALTFAQGKLYIDGSSVLSIGQGTIIRAVSARTGQLTSPVGDGFAGLTPDGTTGRLTQSVQSCGVAVDSAGNLIWSDTDDLRDPNGFNAGNDLIRMLAARSGTFYGRSVTAGKTYTIAGMGVGDFGFNGDGIPATSAVLAGPAGLAVDGQGNLVFADTGANRIRVIAASTGQFYGQAMTAGDIYTIAGGGTQAGNGIAATDAQLSLATPNGPDNGVRIDRSGNVVFADCSDNTVRVIAAVSGRSYGQQLTAGDLYTIAGDGTAGDSGDGGVATKAIVGTPQQLAIDHDGNVILSQGTVIRIVATATGQFFGRHLTAGHIYQLAQADRPGLAVDGAGNLVFSNYAAPGIIVVSALGNRAGTDFDRPIRAGQLTTVAGNGQVWQAGDGGPALRAQFGLIRNSHIAVVGDSAGDLALIDETRVRFLARRSGEFFGQPMTADHIYAIAGRLLPRTTCAARSGPGPTEAIYPVGVAFDPLGNLVTADACGIISVVAVRSGRFDDQAMLAGDNYPIGSVGHLGQSNHFSGQFGGPWGIGVDRAGNVVIAVSYQAKVEVLAEATGTFYGQHMTAGHVYTIAGTGAKVSHGDGGPAAKASLSPETLVLDHEGDVIVGDSRNSAELLIAEHAGQMFGRAVTPGHIYKIGAVSSILIGVDASDNLTVAGANQVGVVAAQTGTFYGMPMSAGTEHIIADATTFGAFGAALQADDWQIEAIGSVPGGIVVLGGSRIWLL